MFVPQEEFLEGCWEVKDEQHRRLVQVTLRKSKMRQPTETSVEDDDGDEVCSLSRTAPVSPFRFMSLCLPLACMRASVAGRRVAGRQVWREGVCREGECSGEACGGKVTLATLVRVWRIARCTDCTSKDCTSVCH